MTRFFAVLFALSVAACGEPPAVPVSTAAGPPQRIVSIIPATTEMIFAMGAGDRVVGVGSYDRFPPDIEGLPRVGGLIDPNTERILALKPDLVVAYGTQTALVQRLERARIPYFAYEHRTLPDIMATVRALGERLDASGEAEAVAADMERTLERIRLGVAGRPRPRTLLVIGRDPGTLRNINASGGYGFLSDLLDVAGGENVFADLARQSVQVSTEMLLTLAPDVIIELRYSENAPERDDPDDLAAWNTVPAVPAVRNRRVRVLTGDEFVVPGPRIRIAAERLARALAEP
jgi:iron complex transport system substrate-binding protein